VFDRRAFLVCLAASVASGITVIDAHGDVDSAPVPAPKPARTPVPLPGGGALSTLPTSTSENRLALTVDDGTNAEVIRAYTQFAHDSGVRLTFFVNGVYSGWTEHAQQLRPLVDSGQIQLGNHTWSHPDLTELSASTIAAQLTRNAQFLINHYGADPAPYFRPPYGRHDDRVDSVARDLGYPCPILWNGSYGDSSIVTPDYIVEKAREYFHPSGIVIGHLNHPPVTQVYHRLLDIITERNLRTVTLADVFGHRR